MTEKLYRWLDKFNDSFNFSSSRSSICLNRRSVSIQRQAILIQSVRKNVSNILRGGSTHRNKKKKSHKPWSGNAYFLSYVHLFSDSRRLGTLEDNYSLCHPSERCPDTTGALLQCMPGYPTTTGCFSLRRRAEECIAMDGRHIVHLL
ncbi:hypothetical protein C0J52_12380 [Blattella germanica]|nr:hypothetical protein C0J52_12380 [Blattella germanica]